MAGSHLACFRTKMFFFAITGCSFLGAFGTSIFNVNAAEHTVQSVQSLTCANSKVVVSSVTSQWRRTSMAGVSWQDAVAGACAGAVAKTATAPMERVKLV